MTDILQNVLPHRLDGPVATEPLDEASAPPFWTVGAPCELAVAAVAVDGLDLLLAHFSFFKFGLIVGLLKGCCWYIDSRFGLLCIDGLIRLIVEEL